MQERARRHERGGGDDRHGAELREVATDRKGEIQRGVGLTEDRFEGIHGPAGEPLRDGEDDQRHSPRQQAGKLAEELQLFRLGVVAQRRVELQCDRRRAHRESDREDHLEIARQLGADDLRRQRLDHKPVADEDTDRHPHQAEELHPGQRRSRLVAAGDGDVRLELLEVARDAIASLLACGDDLLGVGDPRLHRRAFAVGGGAELRLVMFTREQRGVGFGCDRGDVGVVDFERVAILVGNGQHGAQCEARSAGRTLFLRV